MNLYTRQETLNLNTKISITICGAGGVGYWVAKFAAMSGVEKIYIYDHDVIEEHNLNRLDLPISAVGKNKAMVVKSIINSLRPEATVYAFPFKFKRELYTKKTDWIIDCTDRSDVQEMIQGIANDTNTHYMKVGYNGEHITLSDVVAEWGESTNGYTVVPSWVVPASVVAALAVGKLLKYQTAELSANLHNLYIV